MSFNDQICRSLHAVSTALSLNESLHLSLYNKEIKLCLLMPGLMDSGKNDSKQCVDHC